MRQALHAEQLQFEHPITGKKLKFYSKLPPELERLGDALRIMPDKPTDRRRATVRKKK
jgi:23S rRNA pseudouridine1911/1915/1917 synthase